MRDLEKMSDAELMEIAGLTNPMEKMSDEQLKEIAAGNPDLTPKEAITGIGANLAQGATFGTGGLIAGVGNVIGGQAANLVNRLRGTPEIPETVAEEFKQGKEQFRNVESKYQRAHPVVATLAQIAGGAGLGGKAVAGITKAAPLMTRLIKGGITGAEFGGGYAAGGEIENVASAALNKEKLAPSITNLVKTGAMGAAIGIPFGVATTLGAEGVAKLSDMTSKYLGKSGAPELLSAVAKDTTATAAKETPILQPRESITSPERIVKEDISNADIKRSIDTKTPLLYFGGNNVQRLAQTAKLLNTNAEDLLAKVSAETLSKQPAQLTDIVNKSLSSKSKLQNLDDIMGKYEAEAKPMYNKAFEVGDIPETSNLVKDDLLQKYIKTARGSAVGRELKGLPDTHIKVLDAAKKKIDDAIGVANRSGEREEARALQNLNSELKSNIDSIVPEYAQARSMAAERFKLEEAQNTAAKIVRAETPEAIEKIMPTLSPAEKEAFTIGLRDEIMKQISSSKSTNSNIAYKIFGDSENYIVRKNLRAALGDAEYGKLMETVNPLVEAGKNVSKLMSGSPTAQRESYKVSGLRRLKYKIINKVIGHLSERKYEDVAKMLVDPEYLATRMDALTNAEKLGYQKAIKAAAKASGIISGQGASQ